MKKVYVLLADGFETIEATAPIDILRRCKVDVTTVSISGSITVTCSHNIQMKADTTLDGIAAEKVGNAIRSTDTEGNNCCSDLLSDGDMIVLPGGYPGYVNLMDSDTVGKIIRKYYKEGKWVAAICGAPAVLAKNKIAAGSHITCHSSVIDKMGDYIYTGRPVEQDGNLITGIGAGLSIDFGIKLARVLTDRETVELLKKRMEIRSCNNVDASSSTRTE